MGNCCGVIVVPKRIGCPGAAVSRGYTTNGLLAVSELSCQMLVNKVVMAAPACNVVFAPSRQSSPRRGPQPFLSSRYGGSGLINSCDPPGVNTGPDVRPAGSRIGESIS